MASVWKRLQRVNKRAAKFQYTASYHRIDLETSAKWKPNKLSIVWTRRSRRAVTKPLEWEPSLKDPLKGSVLFPVPENRSVAVTLFKDSRTNELEDKDWTFELEDVSPTGKHRRLATCSLNMRLHASLSPSSRPLSLVLSPLTHKITAASIGLTLHCVLLREGRATDEDMQSLASLLSVNNNSDIAVLEDLDEDDYTLSDHSSKQVLDLRQQMEELTSSLTSSDVAATPNSVQSLNFDNSRTPTAPLSPATPTPGPEYNHDLNAITPRDYGGYAPKPDYNSYNFTASTPFKPETNPDSTFKAFQFKTKPITKMNLKPLDLKTNLNSIVLDGKGEKGDKNDNKSPEETPVEEKLFIGRMDKDKTPVQDLLEWCQSVTAEYHSCKVTNLTTSFTSGLAFCAIIHHYRPDLIDFSGLQPDEAEANLRVALAASAALGLPPLCAARDVRRRDRLAIMTYLFQLRAHFTGGELQVEQLGSDEAECSYLVGRQDPAWRGQDAEASFLVGRQDTESSYLVGRHDTDQLMPRELFSREVVARRSLRMMAKETVSSKSSERSTPERVKSPASEAPRDSLLSPAAQFIGKVLSPTKELRPLSVSTTKWFTDPLQISTEPPPKPEKLMTRKELTDPFGSDEEDEQDCNGSPEKVVTPEQNQSPEREPEQEPEQLPSPGPRPTPQLLSRHDELKERARQLLEATKREAREKDKNRRQSSKEKEEFERNGDLSPMKPMTEEERQAMLRERARKLIANARAGILSPTSPTNQNRGRVEIISKQSVMEEMAQAGGLQQLDAILNRQDSLPSTPGSRKSSSSPDRSAVAAARAGSPLRSFSALVQRLSPDADHADEPKETGSYIQSEQEALEKEQKSIDSRAAALERQLRAVMERGADAAEEDRLLAQWFNLVNKKNALLRRQMQLNILEQEEDLSRRCDLLARELRLSLAVEEWRKTQGQRRRERLLLQELLEAVNERDRLVQEMDEQEKAIADDDEIQRNLSQVELQRKNNCILQ